ncbi:MAG: hypothetical protein OEY52_08760 [Gammaproteobacteria bacterium]|nr:hypothetical protein [Gammaproteobacteria bacterium]
MIVIITNRNINPGKTDETLFGNDMSDDGLRVAEYKYEITKPENEFDWLVTDDFDDTDPVEKWTATLYEKGKENDCFDKIIQTIQSGDVEANRPWMMFLHGNNQDMQSNLVKCRKLSKVHNVNVIAFSWPSQPNTFVKDAKESALNSVTVDDLKNLMDGIVPDPATLGLKFLVNLIDEKREAYEEAKRRAKTTAPAFVESLSMVKKLFLDKLNAPNQAAPFNLLVHSLGNQVFQHSNFPADNSLNDMFTNVIMHQADVQGDDHASWIHQRMTDVGQHGYVTINYYDWVLFLSNLANGKERLGMYRQNLDALNVTYFDFTQGTNVENLHNFFHMTQSQNASIHNLFGNLLKGQTGLDYSQLDFEKSELGSNVYKLEELEEIIDTSD